MRKRYRVLVFAALVAALGVPVGFALSLESGAGDLAVPTPVIAAATVAAPLAADSATATRPNLPSIPDGAKLLLVGTTLFGLASAVRKAS
jgi:hypothetical protein